MQVTGTLRLRKSEVADIAKLRKILTIDNPEFATFSRFRDARYAKEVPSEFLVYIQETDHYVEVPRNVPADLIDAEKVEDLRLRGRKIKSDFTFKGTPRDYQAAYLATIDPRDTDFIMVCPPGHGKSFMALWKVSKWKVKTIILVPTLYLAQQWAGEIDKNIPGASYCIFEKKHDYREYDIVIINLDRVNATDFDGGFWNEFGLCITDECHRNGAYTYFPIVGRINSYYRVALTATFRRTDGVHHILKYVFGRVYTMESKFVASLVVPFKTGIKFDQELYMDRTGFVRIDSYEQLHNGMTVLVRIPGEKKTTPAKIICHFENRIQFADKTIKFRLDDYDSVTSYKQKTNFALLDNVIAEDASRNRILTALVKKLLRKGRCVLFLSKRRTQLEIFHEMFKKMGYKSALIVGGPKHQALLEYAKDEAQVIFGIDKLAKEGMDVPRCDTLVLHNPIKDIEQAKGRIERFFPGKQEPLFFYVLDDEPIEWSLFRASHQYLKGSKIAKEVTWQEYFELLKL